MLLLCGRQAWGRESDASQPLAGLLACLLASLRLVVIAGLLARLLIVVIFVRRCAPPFLGLTETLLHHCCSDATELYENGQRAPSWSGGMPLAGGGPPFGALQNPSAVTPTVSKNPSKQQELEISFSSVCHFIPPRAKVLIGYARRN
jgi:hypothetical protein